MDKKDTDLFNEVYKEISMAVGVDAAMKIFHMYKGQQISFPVHLFSSKRIQDSIVSEYDGANIRELAKKYAYSEKTVRRIIKENLKD